MAKKAIRGIKNLRAQIEKNRRIKEIERTKPQRLDGGPICGYLHRVRRTG